MSEPEEGGLTPPIESAILIAGPTASGKSEVAARIAAERRGIVVNADSMQVYRSLRVLTARPGPDKVCEVPHRLYGHVDPARTYSTGAWLRDVGELAVGGALRDRTVVFAGGTGLYFRALLGGLSRMPEVPVPVREKWRARLCAEGAASLHAELARLDPGAADKIRRSDGQRIVRALELNEASGGRPLAEIKARRIAPLVDPDHVLGIVLAPERAVLRERIDRRVDRMLDDGALEEVQALMRLGLAPDLPAMKAIGVRELADHLDGRVSLEEASRRMKVATHRYAKRQNTWFRNQMGEEWQRACDIDEALAISLR